MERKNGERGIKESRRKRQVLRAPGRCRFKDGDSVGRNGEATLIAAGVAVRHCRVRLRCEKLRSGDDTLWL